MKVGKTELGIEGFIVVDVNGNGMIRHGDPEKTFVPLGLDVPGRRGGSAKALVGASGQVLVQIDLLLDALAVTVYIILYIVDLDLGGPVPIL